MQGPWRRYPTVGLSLDAERRVYAFQAVVHRKRPCKCPAHQEWSEDAHDIIGRAHLGGNMPRLREASKESLTFADLCGTPGHRHLPFSPHPQTPPRAKQPSAQKSVSPG